MSKNTKPNIILLVMDVQRATNMHCYGYPKDTTPNIDKIAREGILFKKCISPGSWTLPSHASMFTGRYIYGHGVGQSHTYFQRERYTLAEVLKTSGYKTVGMCNHDHWWCLYGINYYRGFDRFYRVQFKSLEEWVEVGSEKHMKIAIEWIKENHEKPFFMFINCLEPHRPYYPPLEFRKKFYKDISLEEMIKLFPDVWHVRMGKVNMTKEMWEIHRKLYDGVTAALDHRMKLLFDFLEDTGIMDDTMLIITSDHGDEQGEHYPPYVAHSLHLYQPVLHVPLIIRYPSLFPENKTYDGYVQTHDLFPTILEIIGVKDTTIWFQNQGKSLLKILEGEEREYALAEHQRPLHSFDRILTRDRNFDFRMYDRNLKALFIGKYKYIWASNGADELYDLENDPLEQNNLVNEKQDIVNMMKSKLMDILRGLEYRDLGDFITGDDENIKILERLGYKRGTSQFFNGMMGMTV
ncbi:MAG: hypothetical protein DRJ64_08350 [Thermoprotei archaeon]|nr:MAG: hypothetical protein DRJ64_08350 [Thermoprotei archaeon]